MQSKNPEQYLKFENYICPYRSQVSLDYARNCIDLLDLETFECRFQEFCVAEKGLQVLAQSSAKVTKPLS
jgi:hypothetical protein